MHDPMHVVLDVLRPWPQVRKDTPMTRRRAEANPSRRHRQFGPLNIRAREFKCAHCDDGRVKNPPPSYHEHDGYHPGAPCPDCGGRGFNRVPHRRRPYFYWSAWRFGERELYFPPLVTLWHVDPETDGTDSSCRNRYRVRWREAHLDNDALAKWFWGEAMRHYDKWHVQHWRIQVRPLQALRRWLFTRCAGCGQRMPYGYSPISRHWDAPPHRWWESEVGLYHHHCARSTKGAPTRGVVA